MRFSARLADAQRWPTFRIPLAEGHEIFLIYRNFVEDEAVEYLLNHPSWPAPMLLVIFDGNPLGPGMSWSELLAASLAPPDADGVSDHQRRLLLLLPIVSDAELPGEAEAVTTIAGALASCGAKGNPDALARSILREHRVWDPVRWWRDESSTWICDGRNSLRNPSILHPLPSDDLARISAALNP